MSIYLYECVFVPVDVWEEFFGNRAVPKEIRHNSSLSYHIPRNSVMQVSQGELRLEINKDRDPLLISHGVFYRQ